MNDKNWSIWYDYKGRIDLQDELWTEIEFKDPIDKFHTTFVEMACNNQWERAKRYRINLDGVIIYEYRLFRHGSYWVGEKEGRKEYGAVKKREVIGHDPHHKIIICEKLKMSDQEHLYYFMGGPMDCEIMKFPYYLTAFDFDPVEFKKHHTQKYNEAFGVITPEYIDSKKYILQVFRCSDGTEYNFFILPDMKDFDIMKTLIKSKYK